MIGRLGFLVAGLTILAGTSDGEVAAQRGPAARPSHSGTAPSLLRPAAAPAQAGLPAEPVSSETAPPPPQAALSAPQTALFSAVVPGTGQMALGQRRAWAYLALETVGWIAYLDRRSAGSELRNRYRDFAWTEARL
ncbi:MAG: hypothetical protein GWN71_24430, partial [Gammaproteobacteria bacterium]|nr:hypothetical protein [Gemmatimonadota bacterium]NIR38571.1 hypothetical protein [Actinomycetota bacterium]NIU76593.1 hypothetical protein [Gammaproteobacteria bacterium]